MKQDEHYSTALTEEEAQRQRLTEGGMGYIALPQEEQERLAKKSQPLFDRIMGKPGA